MLPARAHNLADLCKAKYFEQELKAESARLAALKKKYDELHTANVKVMEAHAVLADEKAQREAQSKKKKKSSNKMKLKEKREKTAAASKIEREEAEASASALATLQREENLEVYRNVSAAYVKVKCRARAALATTAACRLAGIWEGRVCCRAPPPSPLPVSLLPRAHDPYPPPLAPCASPLAPYLSPRRQVSQLMPDITLKRVLVFQDKFILADADSSGLIDEHELAKLLTSCCDCEVTLEMAVDVIKQVDTDDSGHLDFVEVVRLRTRSRCVGQFAGGRGGSPATAARIWWPGAAHLPLRTSGGTPRCARHTPPHPAAPSLCEWLLLLRDYCLPRRNALNCRR